MKALIVDDSVVMRRVVERALLETSLGVTSVVEAGNGLEALQVLRANKDTAEGIDLILTDINMPVMDGLIFLEHLQREKLAPNVPVVIITTEGGEAQVLRAIAAGARGYICKPFTADQVRSRVGPLLRSSS